MPIHKLYECDTCGTEARKPDAEGWTVQTGVVQCTDPECEERRKQVHAWKERREQARRQAEEGARAAVKAWEAENPPPEK